MICLQDQVALFVFSSNSNLLVNLKVHDILHIYIFFHPANFPSIAVGAVGAVGVVGVA